MYTVFITALLNKFLLLWRRKFRHSIQNSPPLDPILDQMNPVPVFEASDFFFLLMDPLDI
jgi:hypothetical protein